MLSVKQIELKGAPTTLAGAFDSSRPAGCAAVKSNSDTCCTAERIDLAVKISPDDTVARRAVTWDGMAAEIVKATRYERIELRFRAPHHLLAVYEQGERRDGETFVDGLPRSTLRDCKRKLTFVPAGHECYEWQEPRSLARVGYFYVDPAKMPAHLETGVASTAWAPRHAPGHGAQADEADRERKLR